MFKSTKHTTSFDVRISTWQQKVIDSQVFLRPYVAKKGTNKSVDKKVTKRRVNKSTFNMKKMFELGGSVIKNRVTTRESSRNKVGITVERIGDSRKRTTRLDEVKCDHRSDHTALADDSCSEISESSYVIPIQGKHTKTTIYSFDTLDSLLRMKASNSLQRMKFNPEKEEQLRGLDEEQPHQKMQWHLNEEDASVVFDGDDDKESHNSIANTRLKKHNEIKENSPLLSYDCLKHKNLPSESDDAGCGRNKMTVQQLCRYSCFNNVNHQRTQPPPFAVQKARVADEEDTRSRPSPSGVVSDDAIRGKDFHCNVIKQNVLQVRVSSSCCNMSGDEDAGYSVRDATAMGVELGVTEKKSGSDLRQNGDTVEEIYDALVSENRLGTSCCNVTCDDNSVVAAVGQRLCQDLVVTEVERHEAVSDNGGESEESVNGDDIVSDIGLGFNFCGEASDNEDDTAGICPDDPVLENMSQWWDVECNGDMIREENNALDTFIEINGDKMSNLMKNQLRYSNKRVLSNLSRCTFCGTTFYHIARHLLEMHGDQVQLKRIHMLPKNSPERRVLLAQLIERFDVDRSCFDDTDSVSQSEGEKRLRCTFCKIFFNRSVLALHMKTCYKRLVDQADFDVLELVTAGKPVPNNNRGFASSHLSTPIVNEYQSATSDLMDGIRNDRVKRVIAADKLMCRYASWCLESSGSDWATGRSRFDKYEIRNSVRLLGRLLIEVRRRVPDVTLDDLIAVDRIDLLVETATLLSSRNLTSPYPIALELGHLLKHVARIKVDDASRLNDGVAEAGVRQFILVLESEWSVRVVGCDRRSFDCFNSTRKASDLPLTQDLVKLGFYIRRELCKLSRKLVRNPSANDWRYLARMTMARLLLLNKRRTCEVKNMTLLDYSRRPVSWIFRNDAVTTDTMDTHLQEDKIQLVVNTGKSSHGEQASFVFIPPDARHAIELLIDKMKTARISSLKPYIFSRATSYTAPEDSNVLQQIALRCDHLTFPMRITPKNLRRYVKSVIEVLDIDVEDKDTLASHLGHKTGNNSKCTLQSTHDKVKRVHKTIICE